MAIALPVLVMVTAAGMAAVVIVGAQLRCVDAAREGARAAARGESIAAAHDAALEVAPAGAQVVVTVRGDQIVVVVSAEVRFPARLVRAVTVDARVIGPAEPGVGAVVDVAGGNVAAATAAGGSVVGWSRRWLATPDD
jgi:hypothetical protein